MKMTTTSRRKRTVLASASASESSNDDNRATSAAAAPSTSSTPSSSDTTTSPDEDRRARLSRVLASTASSTFSAAEAHALLSRSGFPPSDAAVASALVEAALSAGNATLALDVFRAMAAPPLPAGGCC